MYGDLDLFPSRRQIDIFMGNWIYPSGSLEPVGVMSDSWAKPTIYRPILIPVGALVEILPLAGPLWGGIIGVVVARLGNEGTALCKVAGIYGTIDLPEYILRLLSLPVEKE